MAGAGARDRARRPRRVTKRQGFTHPGRGDRAFHCAGAAPAATGGRPEWVWERGPATTGCACPERIRSQPKSRAAGGPADAGQRRPARASDERSGSGRNPPRPRPRRRRRLPAGIGTAASVPCRPVRSDATRSAPRRRRGGAIRRRQQGAVCPASRAAGRGGTCRALSFRNRPCGARAVLPIRSAPPGPGDARRPARRSRMQRRPLVACAAFPQRPEFRAARRQERRQQPQIRAPRLPPPLHALRAGRGPSW